MNVTCGHRCKLPRPLRQSTYNLGHLPSLVVGFETLGAGLKQSHLPLQQLDKIGLTLAMDLGWRDLRSKACLTTLLLAYRDLGLFVIQNARSGLSCMVMPVKLI